VKIERLLFRASESEATGLVRRILDREGKIESLQIFFQEGLIRVDGALRVPLVRSLSFSTFWYPEVTRDGGIRLELKETRAAGHSSDWLRSVLLDWIEERVKGRKGVRVIDGSICVDAALFETVVGRPLEITIRRVTAYEGVLTVEA